MTRPLSVRLAAVGLFVLLAFRSVNASQGRVSLKARDLADVKRIYVEALGHSAGLGELKSDLITQIRKSGLVEIVSDPGQADAILAATGEIWVKGHYSLNPRSGISPSNGQSVYSGYLSVELKGKGDETIWSYLVTPKTGSTAIARDLSKDAVRKLSLAFATTARK